MRKIGNPRGQGNQLRSQCCQNNGHNKDNCHEHEKKTTQKPEIFKEKKGEVLVILDMKNVKRVIGKQNL